MIFVYVNKNRFLFRMKKKHTKNPPKKPQSKRKQKRTELEDTNDYD